MLILKSMSLKKNNSIVIEFFASTIAITAGFLSWVSRWGFDSNFPLIVKSILIALFLFLTPHLFTTWINEKEKSTWYLSKPLFFLYTFLFLLGLGKISILLDLDISILVSVAGLIVLVRVMKDFTLRNNYRNTILLSAIFLVFGIWSTSAHTWANYYHPLMKEKIIAGAWAHREPIWHASMAGMYKTYGVMSTGLDGLVPIYYHNLGHLVYGLMSGLLTIDTNTFLNICVPIIFVPLFFYTFILSAQTISVFFGIKFIENDYKVWVIVLSMFALPLPMRLLPETYHYINSPSYSTALILMFLFISINFLFFRSKQENNVSVLTKEDVYFVSLLILLYFFTAFSKISFLYILGTTYAFILYRLKLYNSSLGVSLILGLTLVAILMYFRTIVPLQDYPNLAFNESGGPILPGFKRLSYYLSELRRYSFYIYPSFIYIVLKLRILGIKSIASIIKLLRSRKIIDIELLVFLMLLSFIPPYDYFKGIQIYVAYLLILSHLELFHSHLFDKKEVVIKSPIS